MSTEPKRVDVLAIMDAAASTCDRYKHGNSARNLPKARAAVAELIDVSKIIQSRLAEGVEIDAYEWTMFDDALNRIGGTP